MKRIDTHCHFFNIQYAFREALVIGWDMLRGEYPYDAPEKKKIISPPDRKSKEWKELIRYIVSLTFAATRKCKKQYDFEQKQYSKSYLYEGDEELRMAPLMMDIYYIFDKDDYSNSLSDEKYVGVKSVFSSNTKRQFEDFAKELKEDVEHDIHSIGYDRISSLIGGISSDELQEEVSNELQKAIDDFLSEKAFEKEMGDGPKGYWLSWGFKKHMKDLGRLQSDYPENILPFLAVDPRRRKIAELVREKVGDGKIFKGIKLYPALGYLPTHPNLYPVYDYCIENDIPITVHCSTTGLPSLAGEIYVKSTTEKERWVEWDVKDNKYWPCVFFGEPQKWLPILNDSNGRYKNLRLNFAHYGSGDIMWRVQINGLMKNFPNVYADLSYCYDDPILDDLESIIKTEPELIKKLIFGTDYIMVFTGTEAWWIGKLLQ